MATLQPGARLWNGATVTPSLAAAYNSIQARIASFTDAGKPAPDYLLNGAHNLIAGAPKDDGAAIDALRALDVPAMPAAAIYGMREAIAGLITSAQWDCRELQDHAETRARGWTQREYVESVLMRLQSVTRP